MLKHVLAGHGSLASGMHQSGHIMASGNADATVRLWDLRSGICLQTLGSGKDTFTASFSVQIDYYYFFWFYKILSMQK